MQSCLYVAHLTLSTYTLDSRRFPMKMIKAVLDEGTGKLMKCRHLMKSPNYCQLYGTSYGNELEWISQGISGLVKGTDTIFFIKKAYVPTTRCRDVTYVRIVVNYRPDKSDPYCTRLIVGGNKVKYPHDCGTPTANLLTVKPPLNSVVSTPGSKFMTINIKNL